MPRKWDVLGQPGAASVRPSLSYIRLVSSNGRCVPASMRVRALFQLWSVRLRGASLGARLLGACWPVRFVFVAVRPSRQGRRSLSPRRGVWRLLRTRSAVRQAPHVRPRLVRLLLQEGVLSENVRGVGPRGRQCKVPFLQERHACKKNTGMSPYTRLSATAVVQQPPCRLSSRSTALRRGSRTLARPTC